MAAGQSAAEQAQRERQRVEKLRIQVAAGERHIEALTRGSQGERRLPELLRTLPTDRYVQLFDRRWPHSDANVDAIVVGPFGVAAVDAKNWSGNLEVCATSLKQNGRYRDPHVAGVRGAADAIRASLMQDPSLQDVPVWGVMCFVGEARISSQVDLNYVRLLNGRDLAPFVLSFPARYGPQQADAIHGHLVAHLPPRTGRAPLAELRAPTETVVFLHPWPKVGQSRLYAKDVDGKELGYLDLVTGRLESSPAPWHEILQQLLPHYLQGEAAIIAGKELTPKTIRGIRAFLDAVLGRPSRTQQTQPLIVGRFWANYGKRRLYVDRVDGARTQVGWYDLATNYVSANGDAKDLVAFCGGRFQSFKP